MSAALEYFSQMSIDDLHLESDYSESDLQSLKLRIEALLEMIAT
jgi:benzoyl-CoA reductase/2-hydroxyglutaryl-CoA dehydratase subunit BcrC/BadD/HgdB